MRVLEIESPQSYNMGKSKKHKLRKSKENEVGGSDSTDEGAAAGCPHINKAVNIAAMRKSIQKQAFGECLSCSKDPSRARRPLAEGEALAGVEEVFMDSAEPTLWVCLQCGHQGCDRNSHDKHALKHFEAPRSSCHALVINTTSWSAWCYECDDEVPIERNKKLTECADILKRQAGIPMPDPSIASAALTGRQSPLGAAGGACAPEISNKDNKGRPLTPRSGSCQKVKGLSNLGNTCFFNAVMQNLTQTPNLESLLLEKTKKGRLLCLVGKVSPGDSDLSSDSGDESDNESLKELPSVEIVLGEPGPLTQSLMMFLLEMTNATNRNAVVNPGGLFSQVCKKAPRFKGYQQQDSHELLRYLLDVMRIEEIKRAQAGILKSFKLNEKVNPKKVDEETKFRIKEYGHQAKHTFLDSLFGGQLISTVVCEECRFVSQIFEPFLDLSLPVTEEKPLRPNVSIAARKKDSTSCVGEGTEETVKTGADKFAHGAEPSRKQKRQAKKEAKKKAKLTKKKSLFLDKTEGEGGDEEDEKCMEDGDKEDNNDEREKARQDGCDDDEDAEKQGRENEEDNSSNREDPSDADVEDNLESDTSRSKFGVLTLESDISYQILTEDSIASTIREEPGEEIDGTRRIGGQTGENTVADDSGETIIASSSSTVNTCDISSRTIIGDSQGVTTQPTVMENGLIEGTAEVAVNPHINTDSKQPLLHPAKQHCNPHSVDFNNVNSLSKLQNGIDTELCSGFSTLSIQEVDKTDGNIGSNFHGPYLKDGRLNFSENGSDSGISLPSNHKSLTGESVSSSLTDSLGLGNKEMDASHCDVESRQSESYMLSSAGVDFSATQACNGGSTVPQLNRQNSKHSRNRRELKKDAQLKSKNSLGHRYQPSSRECSIMSCLNQFTSAELLTGHNRFGCKSCTKQKRKQNPAKDVSQVYSNASKQYLIFTPPSVLTLHLKRFEQVGFTSRKVNRHVDFPFVLDLAPYCSSLCQNIRPNQKKILYSLYGVVEHSGRLNAGHYTAYVRVRANIGALTNFLHSHDINPRDYIRRYTESVMNGERGAMGDTSEENIEETLVPPGRWYHISDSSVSEVTESYVERAQAYLLFYERIY